MERWEAIAGRAAEVLRDYERRTGRPAFKPGRNVAEVIEDIARECFGLEVLDSSWLEEGVLGELDLEGKKISVREGLEPQRRAFTVAHDVGHAALAHAPRLVDLEEYVDEQVGLDKLEAQDGVYQAYDSRDLLEIEANLFAAELLAPTERVLEVVEEVPGWTAEDLAERFGISETAMLTQLANVLLMRRAKREIRDETPDERDDADAARPRLDPHQSDAVTAKTPAFVIAGPGAGKTRVLAERYAYLVGSGVPAEKVLALTFSNKAAEEMRVRVSSILGGGYRDVQAHTFHGFCLELLKGYGRIVGLPEGFSLLTDADAPLLVRGRLHELELSYLEDLSNPGLYVPGVLAAISRAKDELRSPEELEGLAREWAESAETATEREDADKALEAAKVYGAYQGWLRDEGYVDYGDLVHLGIEVLKHPGAADEIRARYGQILVDEFQDINFAMGRLLRALDGGRGVVWAVADPDQSIYRFRGASPANLECLEDDYPGLRTISLATNYRSVPDIVGACHGLRRSPVSAGGENGTPPPLEPSRSASEEPAVSLVVAPDREAELDHLVESVRARAERGVPLGDQAVLCSTNAQARMVVGRLSAAGLAAQGPASLLGAGEIKNALAVVSLLREGDGAGLVRISNSEDNPLTDEDAAQLLAWAREQGCTAKEALSRCDEVEKLGEEAVEFLTGLGRFLDGLPGWKGAWRALLAYVFHPESRLRRLFFDPSEDARRRLLQVGQLAVLARSFGEREGLVEGTGIPGFLEYVRELAASGKGDSALYTPPAREAVQVMTVHKSKGLEFPVVYVPGLDRFPGRGGGAGDVKLPPGLVRRDRSEERDEENRCLFYVALTRAEDELVMSRVRTNRSGARVLSLIDQLVKEKDGRVMFAEKELVSPASGTAEAPPRPGETFRGRAASGTFSFRQMDRYRACPMKFKYGVLFGLPEKRSAYQDFHNSVYRVLVDMEIEAKETGRNPGLDWVEQRLAQVWEQEGPADHFYEPVYRRRAERVVEKWQASEAALTQSIREKLPLRLEDGTRMQVTADAIGRDADGGIVVARHRFGRHRKSHEEKHHLDRYTAYAVAARQTWPEAQVSVELHYLDTGKIVDVTPSPTVVSNRTKKLQERAEGARFGRYPPNAGRECKGCSWNLICPASA